MTTDLAPQRRDRRATSNCEIWDMVAPDLPCPACDDGFVARLERTDATDGPFRPVSLVQTSDDVVVDVSDPADVAVAASKRRSDVRLQASELLSLLAG